MILYSLEELYNGATITCPECKGRKKIHYHCGPNEGDYRNDPCKACGSKGIVRVNLEVIDDN